jgi:hypothetical protein
MFHLGLLGFSSNLRGLMHFKNVMDLAIHKNGLFVTPK